MSDMLKNTGYIFLCSALFFGCAKREETKLFEEQLTEKTSIDFENKVVQNGENNVLNYPYYFNGGGVAVGDINNDGLQDVYFSGNIVPNKLYLNKGNFQFEDITEKAGVAAREGWKTGVTMCDVNQDGLLDIYVCRSAMGDSVLRKNLLFINNGNMTFTEKADSFGVADNSYSTQAAFFDYDKDGDADLFVLNHSLPKYAGFNNMLVNFKNQKGTKFQSKLYQNDNGRFHNVSEKSGIINNVLSFGLGLAIADVNNDGWADIYISNDFNEEDYLYINNRDGTFKNTIREATGHVSLFSMGSDIADVNNDARPDIFTLDMLPETNERIKLSSGDDNYDKYRILVNSGFHHQSMRNMLHLNNGNGTFSEIGQLMGISNTDWSWAAFFVDFNGDGWKDLFVSNGYEKDYTNMQFLKYTVDERIKSRETGQQMDLRQIIGQMPSIQVGNFLFMNNGNMSFSKKTSDWGISRQFKSNGAAYADLDNDGDPDLVINTMNEKSIIYKNTTSENKTAAFVKIDLKASNPKRIIDGTKVYVYTAGKMQYQEYSPVRGFQSSMNGPLIFGLGLQGVADSIRVIWPDNKTQLLKSPIQPLVTPRYEEATTDYKYPAEVVPLFNSATLLEWKHEAIDTNDFKLQILLPKMYSYSGPKIARGDVNGDGLDDLYICGPSRQSGSLQLQQKDGSFRMKVNPSFEKDKNHQDEDAVFFDADGDGDRDLYVVSGGYFFSSQDASLQDRLYINDGQGNFTRSASAVPNERLAGSCVEALDIDGDNDLDLFVGSRFTPGKYPLSSPNMLLINDGKGKFSDGILQFSPSLQNLGMICDASATDINKDGKTDLVVAGEWTSIKVFVNAGGQLSDESSKWISSPASGWWNCMESDDLDGDGDIDFIVGNYGLNNQFNVSPSHPATLVYKDFNNDGQVDPFFCYYIGEQSYPYASRDEALGQVNTLRVRFPDYTTYSNVTLEKIFTGTELENASTLKADNMKTLMLENKGDRFDVKELPVQAQFAPVYAIALVDVDSDGDKDVILGGNESMVRVRIGKSDANEGVLLLNDGKGNFTYIDQSRSGLNLRGDVRDIEAISSNGRTVLIVGETGMPIKSYVINTTIQ
ncbi:MAG TPA: VCBS repeat-containing protein [Chryseolinea sp.]|nr:VCBS repeat-containing protein [Chryseolinea sp.]